MLLEFGTNVAFKFVGYVLLGHCHLLLALSLTVFIFINFDIILQLVLRVGLVER